MSNYYVLDQSKKAERIRCAFHFTTPVGNNTQAIPYATCITEDTNVEKTSVVPANRLDAGAQTDLTNGTTVELVRTVYFSANATNLQKTTAIESKWSSLNTSFQTDIPKIYKFWGAKGTAT